MVDRDSAGEDKRLALLTRLVEVLGQEEARTLMESLPPVLWHELATKADIKDREERLRAELDARFEKIDARFEKIDARFDRVDARFDQIEGRVDARFEKIDARFDQIEGRIDQIEGRVDARFDKIEDWVDARFDKLAGVLERMRGETALQFATQTRTLVLTLVGFALTIWVSLLVVGIT